MAPGNEIGQQLLQLVSSELSDLKLTPAEEALFIEFPLGNPINLSDDKAERNDPGKSEDWGDNRTIHASYIEWLVTNKQAKEHLTHRGIRIQGARIVGSIDLEHTSSACPLELRMCVLTESLVLRHARLKSVNLQGSHINRIEAEDVTIDGNLLFGDGFRCEGEVSLKYGTIAGVLNCESGEFHNPHGNAISADGMNVKGGVFLQEGFKAEGEVRLLGATIGGSLECGGGEFHNPDGFALDADGVNVRGDVFLRDNFKAEGWVSFPGVHIEGWLIWTGVRDRSGTVMDLRGARVVRLWDSVDSWPDAGNLHLQGFCYGEIDDDAPQDAKERIRWLRLQPSGQFFPQPYEQLANVLRKKGYEKAAKEVQIAKNVDRRRRGSMPLLLRPFHCLFGFLTGYGYRPWRPLAAALLLIGVGWGLFHAGAREGIIMKVGTERFATVGEQNGDFVQPSFHPLLYSFDIFLPVITFEQAKNWAPNENAIGRLVGDIPISGLVLCSYTSFLNLAGWILTTLFVATLTGTIRRRM